MASRIPAWKRLGLKLKYANDEPEVLSTTQHVSSHNGERRAELAEATDNSHALRPAKRQRLRGPERASHADTLFLEHGQKGAGSADAFEQSHEKLPKKASHDSRGKKSVSFANDTKIGDGDSRTTIDFPAGSPGSTPRKAKQGKHEEARDGLNNGSKHPPKSPGDFSEIDSKDGPSPVAIEGLVKEKSKSEAAKTLKHQQPTKQKSSTALEYLDQHWSDRSLWKFNKNRDIWVLNHALDTNVIPSSHVLPLAGYVKGLPAQAASRARLVRACQESMSAVEPALEVPQAAPQTLYQALDKKSGALKDAEGLLQKYPRPIILLWALGEDVVQKPTEASANKATSAEEIKRRKKSRTAAPVDISSSSESESESDSDSTSASSSSISASDSGPRDTSSEDSTSSSEPSSSDSD